MGIKRKSVGAFAFCGIPVPIDFNVYCLSSVKFIGISCQNHTACDDISCAMLWW